MNLLDSKLHDRTTDNIRGGAGALENGNTTSLLNISPDKHN